MKLRLIGFATAIAACCGLASAQSQAFVNLTPQPVEMTVGTGELSLPESFTISHSGLSDEMVGEINKFAAALKASTGITATASTGADGLFKVSKDASLAAEGYTLNITAEGVTISAATDAGLFYAFQTIKKILPPNVAVGVAAAGPYALPVVSIADEPRYVWRGFELDVARHYFSVEEIYRMLDIMAVYKMNRFHWHITDDQGWRFEMPKYPKLTTEAAAPLNTYWWDFDNHQRYTTNEMYGPYFYTVEEMKGIVEYARERHIEVCPEVDMPGHMQAAIAAYPEFSTTPDAPHPVRYYPGVSTDVLDISNPAVVQFTKDIIDQLAEIFPYEYIHIGGDECPTSAWANSASCQAFKAEHGLKSDRALQAWLTKELADYARAKHNRKLICWNEVLTTEGADKKMVQDADILIYAWLNAGAANNPSKQAADLGLRSVWCSTNHYYLDYPQWSGSSEPLSMGYELNLERVYNAKPDFDAAKKELYYGVNCNLWTEYISEAKHMEYNALPRMIAVAETGWSPDSKKDFDSFKQRFNADTRMLDLGNYTYGRHYVDGARPGVVYPAEGKYYRLVTCASHDAARKDRCIELVREGSPLISSLSAAAGKLWTNVQAAEGSADYDWQFWTFEADPAGSGLYAMVNRMAPQGSVNPAMEGSSVGATWNYDNAAKHYDFVLGEHFGTTPGGYTYSIRSDKNASWWLNCAQSGQKNSVNNWNNPADGNGGIWLFSCEEPEVIGGEPHPAFTPLAANARYSFLNLRPASVSAYLGVDGNALATSVEANSMWSNPAWTIEESNYNAETNVQTFKLRNLQGLYVGALASEPTNTVSEAANYNGFAGIENGGYEVSMTANASDAATVSLYKLGEEGSDYVLEINGKRLFAFGENSTLKPNGVNARANSPAGHGATWLPAPLAADACASYHFTDADSGADLGTMAGCKLSAQAAVTCPLENYEIVEVAPAVAGTNGALPTVEVKLRRSAYKVTYTVTDTNGTAFAPVVETIPAGKSYTPAAPAISYLKNGRLSGEATAVVPTADLTYAAVYEFEGILGVEAIGEAVKTLEAGKTYVIYDAHDVRHAYRQANGSNVGGIRNIAGASPAATWTLESAGKDKSFYVKNLASGQYIQALKRSTPATLGENPYPFTFNYDTDHWSIKNGQGATMYWDGNDDANLSLVGWNGGTGHPYQFYQIAAAAPYFLLTFEERDQEGGLLSSRCVCVKPGSDYMYAPAIHPGSELIGVEGNDKLTDINENKTVVATYNVVSDRIESVNVDSAADSRKGMFDLSGRRLSRISRPGVYIINGVKTLVK